MVKPSFDGINSSTNQFSTNCIKWYFTDGEDEIYSDLIQAIA